MCDVAPVWGARRTPPLMRAAHEESSLQNENNLLFPSAEEDCNQTSAKPSRGELALSEAEG